MALRASQECEIFDRRAELTPSDETAAALERVRANPTDPDAYMQLGL